MPSTWPSTASSLCLRAHHERKDTFAHLTPHNLAYSQFIFFHIIWKSNFMPTFCLSACLRFVCRMKQELKHRKWLKKNSLPSTAGESLWWTSGWPCLSLSRWNSTKSVLHRRGASCIWLASSCRFSLTWKWTWCLWPGTSGGDGWWPTCQPSCKSPLLPP